MSLVFSTEHGKMCPECEKPIDQCICAQKKKPLRGDGIVRVALDRKGRKGKGVTTITGVPVHLDEMMTICRKLMQKCAAGGTVKNGVIEIQGDHRDVVIEELKKSGYTVKRSGG